MTLLQPTRVSEWPAATKPLLLVVIDTEEEFDWAKPHDRASRSVACIGEQHRAQAIFARYGIVPTYVVDHPVATTRASAAIFRAWSAAGDCVVGTHLHPWVNAPEVEEVTARNSYPGNLPPELEREKLRVLTAAIADNIGVQPTIYKAGRYGLGANSAAILADLGYEIDLSVVPDTSFAEDGGPDFRGLPDEPFWFGPDGRLFEIPLTRGFPGALSRWGRELYEAVSTPLGLRLRLPGILSRLRLLERIQLTPEGVTAEENIRLVRHLLRGGRRVFTYAYHSSSLLPGGSPYVRSADERNQFLSEMNKFFNVFFNEFGGEAATPYQILAITSGQSAPIP